LYVQIGVEQIAVDADQDLADFAWEILAVRPALGAKPLELRLDLCLF
jgi:hypothetical protein